MSEEVVSTTSNLGTATNEDATNEKYDCMVMIYNVGKPANVGNMIRSAVAFGASTLVIVGNRRIKRFGNQHTENYLKELNFDSIEEARTALKDKGYEIIGVEIGEGCIDVSEHPFTGNTVFMFGNEGLGFNEKQYEICDKLIYIPQFGKGTASLNVSNAAAIILHHFATWAKYKQQTISDAKFVVEEDAKVTGKRRAENEEYQYSSYELEKRAARLAKKIANESSIATTSDVIVEFKESIE